MRERLKKDEQQPPKPPEFVCRFQKQEIPRPRHFFEVPAVQHAAGALALIAMSAGVGYAAEAHTNEVARGKALTAQTCLDTTKHDETINAALEKCFTEGVPGGDPIGKDKIHKGDPVAFVDTYIGQQQHEAKSVEGYRVAGWALGGVVVHVMGETLEYLATH